MVALSWCRIAALFVLGANGLRKGKGSHSQEVFRGQAGFVHMHGGPGPTAWDATPDKLSEHVTTEECTRLNEALKPHEDLSEARHLVRFLCENADFQDEIPDLSSGCLYLPTNAYMKQLFDGVEHPNPHHFAFLIMESFFAVKGSTCPTDQGHGDLAVNSRGSSVRSCSEGHGFVGQHGDCLQTELVAEVASMNLHVHSLGGLLGLDARWQKMVEERAASPRPQTNVGALRANSGMKVTIPVEYIVCDPGDGSIEGAVTDKMIQDQNDVLNSDYAGESTCAQPIVYETQQFKTRIQFSLKGITRMTNNVCRDDCNDRIRSLTSQVAPREDGVLKVIICQTSLLGRASFPGDPDSTRVCLIRPGSLPGGATNGYNLGKTLSHEIGHYIGLYHTFQGGCRGGDQVADTEAEAEPMYGCPDSAAWRRNTCGEPSSPLDPIHNVMDYSNDKCMCTFTNGQSDRVWSQMDLMPDFLALAVPDPTAPTPKPTPKPPGNCPWHGCVWGCGADDCQYCDRCQ